MQNQNKGLDQKESLDRHRGANNLCGGITSRMTLNVSKQLEMDKELLG